MIQTQLKLRLNTKQETILTGWLWNLTGVWNWAVRKIELDARDKVFHGAKDFQNLLANHGEKMEMPSHTLQGILSQAHTSWARCLKKLAKKPRLKGHRNTLNSIPFPDRFRAPSGNHIAVPGLGRVRFHRQGIPEGKIKCGRIVRRPSGWYLCLFIDAEREVIERTAHGRIGIDPGFKSLLTTSDGEIMEHPRELEAGALRLRQAQRGNDKTLTSRLQERIANRRKDRNHKLSRRLVAHNDLIAFSADSHKGVAKKFGKSVSSSSHYQLRQMLSYKSRAGGTKYVEVDSKCSTKTCSDCGAHSGPTGWGGLAVRQWRCSECGTLHDRDTNAARNTLHAALGMLSQERCGKPHSVEVCYAQA
jgi:transposase